MVICIIYSRLETLIGHTSDAKPRTPQSLNESATHPPRGRPQGWTSYFAGPLHRLPLPLLFLDPQVLHSLDPTKEHFPETLLPLEKRSLETGDHTLQDGEPASAGMVSQRPRPWVGMGGGGSHLDVCSSFLCPAALAQGQAA